MLETLLGGLFSSIVILGLVFRGPVVLIPTAVFLMFAAFFINTEYGRLVFPVVVYVALFAGGILLVERLLDQRLERRKKRSS